MSTGQQWIARMAMVAACAAVASNAAYGQEWKQYANAPDAGFSAERLERARQFADSIKSAGVFVIRGGHAVAAWGDVARPLELHSVRKSVMSVLYGMGVHEGKIDLDATLESLGIDDRVHPLTAAEKRATVRDLISARSGVFLPAAYAPSDQDERPARGTHAPGTFWFYNNWDFNVAGVIYERLMREDMYESFERRIAGPIGMQDFTVGDNLRVLEPSHSEHPAMTFRMSARDLGRLGQLVLQDGVWEGRRILPEGWVPEMLKSRSDLGSGDGYGYMWWQYQSLKPETYPALAGRTIHQARGTGGQVLWIVPDLDLVIVNRGDTDNGLNVAGRDAWRLADMIAGAIEGKSSSSPRLVTLASTPLASQMPAVPVAHSVILPDSILRQYEGEYDVGGKRARVFIHQGRLFGNLQGLGEAQLFALNDTTFAIRVQPGTTMAFERGASKSYDRIVMKMGGRTMHGTRIAP